MRFVLQRRDTDVENRKNKVGSAERMFAREKRLKFEFAIMTVGCSRCDDRNEEYCLLDRRLNLRFPQLARSDRLLILPQAEVCLGATKLRTQLPLNGVSERRQCPLESLVILAGIAEKPDDFGKVRQ